MYDKRKYKINRYKIKYFKGTNFCGIDFLVLPREIFAQVLIFIYFTAAVTVTGIFSINATPSVRWRLLEGGVLKKRAYKVFKI